MTVDGMEGNVVCKSGCGWYEHETAAIVCMACEWLWTVMSLAGDSM